MAATILAPSLKPASLSFAGSVLSIAAHGQLYSEIAPGPLTGNEAMQDMLLTPRQPGCPYSKTRLGHPDSWGASTHWQQVLLHLLARLAAPQPHAGQLCSILLRNTCSLQLLQLARLDLQQQEQMAPLSGLAATCVQGVNIQIQHVLSGCDYDLCSSPV